jgi:type IV pilus assembly protein PilY1
VKNSSFSKLWRLLSLLLGLAAGFLGGGDTSLGASTPSPIAIYQSPLSVAIAAHPQVVIAFANSESMDGNLSGAIMTGSGSLGSSLSELQNTASPVNFVVPAGFVPPPAPAPGLTAGAVGSSQPYTVPLNGNLVDNSPSRMNLAKAGIYSVLNSFMANTDFALMDYATGSLQESPTWVYYMSAGAGFTVVDTVPVTVPATRAVANPCYKVILTGGDAVGNACQSLSLKISGINAHQWLIIGSSSDDAVINDVLYDWTGAPPVCMAYSGPTPATPFVSPNTLAAYNAGGVTETYGAVTPSGCPSQTGPTNAGFVPYSAQVMYVERGFSYYTGSENSGTGNLLVGMATVGTNLSASNVAAQIAKFTSYLYPETNNQNTTEIKSSSTQAPTAGLLTGALNYYKTGTFASSNGCSASRYVVLVTDGLPTMDLTGKAWPPLGSTAAAGYGVTVTWNADNSLGSTNDQALTDTIATLKALNAAGIKTYIIGLGAGVTGNPQASPTLTAMAIAGGTNVYFPATNPAALTSDMQVIIATIQAGTQSTATAAVNSTSIHVGAVIYQGQFSSSDAAQDWSGNLYAFPINATTGTVNTSPSAALWAAQSLLDAEGPASRVIATWDTVANAGTPFEWTTGSPSKGIASSTLMGQALSNSQSSDTSGADSLAFLRGVQSLSFSNGGPFRARAHLLGDIVDSAPLYVAGASGNFSSTSYTSFVASVASRTPVVYVGANDGMLHAFSAATGGELFAYIPRGVFSNLQKLTGRYYAGMHQFYVDGSPTAGDVNFSNGTWHTLLAGGEGAGGNSIYAIDVTAPQSLTTESALSTAVLWDYTDTTNMGSTYSRPAIINANVGALVVFGNGYNSPSQTPVFYALNAQTGVPVALPINLCAKVPSACNTSVANGLSSIVAANLNGDLSSNATLVYAGDLQGNLWRIDISNVNPTLWTVTVLFQARNASGAMQPITTTPEVTLNPNYPRFVGEMVFVGTGQLLGVGDLSTTQVQSMYGVYDNNSAPTTPILRANMVQQTLTNITINLTGGGTLAGRTDTMNTVNLLQKGGWYVDLSLLSGERIISDPQIDSGAVIVTSIQPSSNVCVGGDFSWLNLFNFATGGAFSSAPLTLTTQTVAGVSLGESYASSPQVEISDSGSSSREILVTESGTGTDISTNGTVPIQGFYMVGSTLHRTAWTELR